MPPNIVLVVLDTARADHLPCYGYRRQTTPRICSLASEGVVYEDAVSPAPWTLPAHASLFTGQPPGRHGLHWGRPDVYARKQVAVAMPDLLLARRLSQNGYRTVGVSANPWVGRSTGLAEGFDDFVEVWAERDEFRQSYEDWPQRWKTSAAMDHLPAGRAVVLTKRALEARESDAPYFLFVNLIDPHMPYSPATDLMGRFGGDATVAETMRDSRGELELSLLAGVEAGNPDAFAALYDEELLTADRAIGNLLDWLDEQGELKDALLIVTSDHGEHLGEDGRYSHQLSMEGALLQVPLLVRFPEVTRDQWPELSGRRVKRRVSLMDVRATILAAAGVTDDDPPDPVWSFDLARLQHWGPRWILAESYASPDYLASLVARNPAFPLAEYDAARRTWFHDGGEYRFRDGVAVAAGELPTGLIQMESEYQASLPSLPTPGSGPAVDEAGRRALEALGYLD